MKARSALTAVLAAALVASGCGAGDPTTEPPDGADPEITLRIGTDDSPPAPSTAQIEEFARQVAELSEGRIAIEPVWDAVGGDDRTDWDQQVARKAIGRDLELALVPSRAWDTEGVDTLRPLNAPFLIDSHELLAEVLTSDQLDAMLSGLDAVGVVGLSAFPEGLRHVFSFEDPLLGVSDYDGATIRTPTSATAQAMFEAFGATADGSASINRNLHTGVESGFVLQPGGVATSNVTFYPKVNVLVANAGALAELSDSDRDTLQRAAENTLAAAIEQFPAEHSLAQEFCAAGGVVVHAEPDQVQSLRTAATSVLTDIRSAAEQNSAVLDAIEELKAGLPATTPAPPCGEQAKTEASGDEGQLNGVFRTEITEQLMRSAWPDTPQEQFDRNVGTWTVSLNDGRAFLHAEDSFDVIEDVGSYTVDGDRVSFLWGDSTTPEVLQWERDDDGSLHFTSVNVPDIFKFVYHGTWQFVPDLEPWDE